MKEEEEVKAKPSFFKVIEPKRFERTRVKLKEGKVLKVEIKYSGKIFIAQEHFFDVFAIGTTLEGTIRTIVQKLAFLYEIYVVVTSISELTEDAKQLRKLLEDYFEWKGYEEWEE